MCSGWQMGDWLVGSVVHFIIVLNYSWVLPAMRIGVLVWKPAVSPYGRSTGRRSIITWSSLSWNFKSPLCVLPPAFASFPFAVRMACSRRELLFQRGCKDQVHGAERNCHWPTADMACNQEMNLSYYEPLRLGMGGRGLICCSCIIKWNLTNTAQAKMY